MKFFPLPVNPFYNYSILGMGVSESVSPVKKNPFVLVIFNVANAVAV